MSEKSLHRIPVSRILILTCIFLLPFPKRRQNQTVGVSTVVLAYAVLWLVVSGILLNAFNCRLGFIFPTDAVLWLVVSGIALNAFNCRPGFIFPTDAVLWLVINGIALNAFNCRPGFIFPTDAVLWLVVSGIALNAFNCRPSFIFPTDAVLWLVVSGIALNAFNCHPGFIFPTDAVLWLVARLVRTERFQHITSLAIVNQMFTWEVYPRIWLLAFQRQMRTNWWTITNAHDTASISYCRQCPTCDHGFSYIWYRTEVTIWLSVRRTWWFPHWCIILFSVP